MRLDHGQRAYGYGSQYKINTQFPFHVELQFQQRDDYFLGYKWTITQSGNEIMMEQRDCSQTLRHMTEDMSQMVIVLSNWDHRDLNWMQHNQCQAAQGGCPRGELNLHQISDIRIRTGGAPQPAPTPGPTPDPWDGTYTYGDACPSLTD